MGSPILYVNACVRIESRIKQLAETLLRKLNKPYEEIRLVDYPFPVVNEDYHNERDRLRLSGNLQAPVFALARQFSEAETIVIEAPFWALSFPAALKQYLEQINAVGITFKYSEVGIPIGLCNPILNSSLCTQESPTVFCGVLHRE